MHIYPLNNNIKLLFLTGCLLLLMLLPQYAKPIMTILLYAAMLEKVTQTGILSNQLIQSSLIFLFSLSLSVVFSSKPYISSQFLAAFSIYFVIMVAAILIINNQKRIVGISLMVAFSGLIIDMYALWQFVSGNNISLMGMSEEAKRIIGGTTHPIIFSGYLMNIIVFSLVLGLKDFKEISVQQKSFFLIAALMTIIVMILTITRGGWLAIEGVLLVWALFELRENKRLALKLLILALSIFAIILLIPSFSERATINEVSANWRLIMWDTAWRIFLEHPITGIGLYQFQDYFYSQFTEGVVPQQGWQNAHSDYFNFLAESGIIGLVSYIAFFSILLWDKYKMYKKYADAWSLMACLLILSLLIEGLTYNYFAISTNMSIFFLIIGLSYSANYISINKIKDEDNILCKIR